MIKLGSSPAVRGMLAGILFVAGAMLPFGALQAQQTVVNTATVAPPPGVVDPNPDNDSDDATITITGAAPYEFCPAAGNAPIFSIANGVEIWQYDHPAGTRTRLTDIEATIPGVLNAAMVDPVNNRLLLHSGNGSLWAYDAGNGGWYEAGTVAGTFPRGGMAPDGTGYLIQGNVANPQVYRVTPQATGYNYDIALIGNLQYDEDPTALNSGDIAFDADGIAWISTGLDLYRIDFSLPGDPVAVRQTRPQFNGNPSAVDWAGVAFASDGSLIMSGLNGQTYAYDFATGNLTSVNNVIPSGNSRDLASCAFPVIAEPELSVEKTLALVGGAAYVAGSPVGPGDVLTYEIEISNTGGAVATLYPGDVVETLPPGTTPVAAGNDFTCTGSDCPNTDAVNVPAGDSIVLRFVVQVDDPIPAGVTGIHNAVLVDGVDCAADPNECEVTTPLKPVVEVSKEADPDSGTAVAVGEEITYTLTVEVLYASLLSDVVVTDTLGTGLELGTVTAPDFTCNAANPLQCTLPLGTAPGTYTVVYTATVTADATTSVENSVTATGGGNDPDDPDEQPNCISCETEHPLTTSVTVEKESDPANGTTVAPGDTITYTLTVVVANAPTTQPLTLVDTLGTGLSFGVVTDSGAFTCTGELTCELPAGTAPGTYALTYTATVDDDATGSVGNNVVATNPPGGDPDPECTSCETEHPLVPTVTVEKGADPANGSTVAPGDTITYTLTVVVANAPTTEPLTLTDTLGAGLSFGAVADPGAFTCIGELTCELPAGTAPGTYAVTYTATVDDDATGSVGNNVVATNPPGGDPDPVCTTCETEHPLVPAVTVSKGSDPANGSTVAPGDTITYTLTVVVANAATTEPLTLVDTLGAGLSFGAVTDPGAFTCIGELTCELPAGTAPGSYAVTYTATVDDDAMGSVGNNVVATNPPGGDPDPVCTTCETEHPLVPAVTVSKGSDPANGSTVAPGDTITYTLTVVVANSPTTQPLTLVDTLGTGLSFGAVTDPGAFTCTGELTCELPAGTAPGSYAVTYTATVDDDATGSVGNNVVATNPPGGDPDPECTTCETEHPLVPTVTVEKGSDPANGTTVAPGDTITYTLTVVVANAATTEPLTLVDTLGAGLSFGSVTNPGPFACSGTLTCELPAGTTPGTYAVTYTATVDDDAMGSVGNNVVATNPPGGDPDPVCTTCETEHPLVPAVTVSKGSDPANGSTVALGDTITYTLTVTVGTSPTTEPLTLVDTLGTGLSFGAVTDPGAFTCTGELTCELPAGTAPGTYAVTYTATVDDDATGSVGNNVVATNPPGGDPDPVCTTCETEHPLVPAVTVEKGSDPANGTTVAPGDTITYTLTVVVANSPTTQPLTLVDTLGAGLSFGSVTNPGPFACSGTLTCELPAGTTPGTYAVTYTATVDDDATGSVGNNVVATNPPGGDPDPECTSCETEHPLVPAVTVSKGSDPANGETVAPGDTLTYTLTVVVANAATTEVLTLVDTLGAGLSFGSVTNPGPFACSGALTCELPAGTAPGSYAVTYTATVDADATGSVGNNVVATNPPGGDPDPICTTCETEHPLVPSVTVEKGSDPASGTTVAPGDTLTYTLTVIVANAATTEVLTLVDTLGAGLSFGSVTNPGPYACSGTLTCELPAGTAPGTYAVVYTATVEADATGSVGNNVVATNPPGGDPDPVCTTCETEHPLVPTVTVEKNSDPANGSTVAPGDTITYTLTVVVGNSPTTEVLTLVDTLGAGLSFGSVITPGPLACTGTLTCELPAGTAPGTYAVVYTATVDDDATGSVGNNVVATNPPGGDPDPECTTCETEHPLVPTVTVEKGSDPANGTTVAPGDTITYTLTVVVANSPTTQPLTLVDTLGAGLSFGAVTDAGAFTCTGELECVLPAGTAPGTYAVVYTATVDADATGSVGNNVVATNPPGGDPDPECTTCETEHEVERTTVTVTKTSDPASGSEVAVGDTITYTLTAVVGVSATTEPVVLTDTLGVGLGFGEVLDAGAFACADELVCTLPAGTLPGSYAVQYTATVDATASGTVGNFVTATGGGGEDPPSCDTCSTEHPLADPVVTVSKSSDPVSGTRVAVGDTIEYTLAVLVENASTRFPVVLVDEPDPGLDIGPLPAGCTASGGTITCVLAAGAAPGVHTFTYTATVNADAGETVSNVVRGTTDGDDPDPECTVCETSHEVGDAPSLRITKSVGSRNVRVGDLVRYTVTVENVGTVNVVDGTIIDTPPAGFSYVESSMSVADGDGEFTLDGTHPLRIGGLDIAVGQQATIVYLLRVGAGVGHGTHINTAVAVDIDGDPVSNVATAQVVVESDPLLDDSLVFGTVFDDRDGDGWQDSAKMTGIRVQGGFSESAYVAGSTTIDRGNGPVPVPDASAPMLHGIDVGDIAGRQSEGDPVEKRRVVIRQLLREPAFDGGFALTSDQGAGLRLDAEGNATPVREGAAEKGLNAADPTVERRVYTVDGGYAVEYVVGNAGIDERGIPGVRIASVEGLLVETDQFGRYHLADVHGGDWARGRNFILKVDPATLPAGAEFTTDNPLLRRVTPGLPVRFDFGVKLPVQVIEGRREIVELELAEVVFAAESSEIRAEYLPAIDNMAAKVAEYRGGEVVITATATRESLAFARAEAVRDALVARVDAEVAAALSVTLRTEAEDPHSMVAGLQGSELLLGTVLFDTDRSAIRPEFEQLLDAVAERIERMGGGEIAIVGHTDVRASHAYNVALGMRRAQSVFDAIAKRLGSEARANLKVDASLDPTAPVGGAGK